MYKMVTKVDNTVVVYLKFAKRVDLEQGAVAHACNPSALGD